jgi:hypothetical protein
MKVSIIIVSISAFSILAPLTLASSSSSSSKLESPISKLPEDLLVKAFSVLSPQDAARAAAVSRQFQIAACENAIKAFCERIKPADLNDESLMSYAKKVASLSGNPNPEIFPADNFLKARLNAYSYLVKHSPTKPLREIYFSQFEHLYAGAAPGIKEIYSKHRLLLPTFVNGGM